MSTEVAPYSCPNCGANPGKDGWEIVSARERQSGNVLKRALGKERTMHLYKCNKCGYATEYKVK